MRRLPHTRRLVSLFTGTLVFCAVIGCGGPNGPESGIVRFSDGSPVQSGAVEFRRKADKAQFSSRITSDGSFQPTSADGVVGLEPGKYEVVVVQMVLTEDLAKDAHAHGVTVPRRYADYYTSGLSVEVKEGQMQPIEITLELE